MGPSPHTHTHTHTHLLAPNKESRSSAQDAWKCVGLIIARSFPYSLRLIRLEVAYS